MPYTVLTDRLTTKYPDWYALHAILPEHLRTNDRFLEFIEAYFEWQQSTPTSPANIINKLVDIKNIDNVVDEFIPFIQQAIAAPIPVVTGVDRRKLYKQITDLYLAKGSLPSYEALFNLLFQDQIELYFPRVDMLKPSSGDWDNTAGRYLDNNGFLSDRKYLQDSYYYQDYSYVIKTSKSVEVWKDIVTKVLHPAGFIFFGEIHIISTPTLMKLKTPLVQPGSLAAESPTKPIIINSIAFPRGIALTYKDLLGNTNLGGLISKADRPLGATFAHLDQVKFTLYDLIGKYEDLVIEPVCLGLKTNLLPSLNQVEIGEGYTDTTILMQTFIYAQPSDLSSEAYDGVIDLMEPSTTNVEIDFQ